MSKFHNGWIKIQREIASYKNVPRIISLKFRCKINIFGHSPNTIMSNKLGILNDSVPSLSSGGDKIFIMHNSIPLCGPI